MPTYLAGADARMDIDGIPFQFKRCRYSDVAPGGDAQMSEHDGFAAPIPTSYAFTGTITQATIDTDESPFFSGPFAMVPGEYYEVILYLDGRTGANRYLIPSALITTQDGSVDVGPLGMQPVDLRIESYGVYYGPGEVPPP